MKEVYPKSKISLYSFRSGYLENFSEDLFYIDEIINIKKPDNFFKIFEKSDLLIFPGHYFKLSGWLKTHLYDFLLFLCRAQKKLVYKDLGSANFKNLDMSKIELNILKKLNIKLNKKDYELFIPFSFKNGEKRINKILTENKIFEHERLVILHLGAKDGYQTRFWPTANWLKLLEYLINKYKSKIVFIGGPDDLGETGKLMMLARDKIVNLVNKLSIKEMTALINRSKLFISTNSGPMWIAAALGKPQIVLCGPSSYQWEPANKKAIVIRKIINRKGCNPPCDKKECEYKDNLCMKKISIEEVKTAVDKIMRQL